MVAPTNQHPGWMIFLEEALMLPRISREQACAFTDRIIFTEDKGLVEVAYESDKVAFLVSDPSDSLMAPLPPIP
jgi:hypothetical protein